MNNRSIRFNTATTLKAAHRAPDRVEASCSGSSLERVCAAVERLRAGEVVAIVAPDSRAGSVHLVVSAELVDARALEMLVTLERGPLRLAVADHDAMAAAAIDLVRMTGSMGGALLCEITERVIAPLRVQALEDWSDVLNVPVVSGLDMGVAADRVVAANAR
jgi:3,4-dihydroxy-2-butanone 4-phosphate synthase